MKKKILSLCLVVALAATAVIGGTLAYFTDKDQEVNVFTMGGVDIDLEEEFGPNGDGTDVVLMPGIDVTKKVTIKNVGESDAWVWYTYKIPAVMDDYDGDNQFLHVINNSQDTKWDFTPAKAVGIDKTSMNENIDGGYIGLETINGVTYHVYLAVYTEIVAVNDGTDVGMEKVVLDSSVNEGDFGYYFINGDGVKEYLTSYKFTNNQLDIIVDAYAIQAEGFDTVYDAYQAYQSQK